MSIDYTGDGYETAASLDVKIYRIEIQTEETRRKKFLTNFVGLCVLYYTTCEDIRQKKQREMNRLGKTFLTSS